MVIVAYLSIGILAGGISAAIADGKHRSALGWFFIGFLFSLLGVILAIVLPANPVSGFDLAASHDPLTMPPDTAPWRS